MSALIDMMEAYLPYAKKNIGFDQSVTIVLESDAENAKNPLGKTAYYSPSDYTVVLYTDNRHPKDVMRSLNHELVHHKQNCDGRLGGVVGEEGYAQTKVGSAIEAEAYKDLTFRNWEDQVKKQANVTSYNTTGDKKMKLTKTKLREMIREAFKKAALKQAETASESTGGVPEGEDLEEAAGVASGDWFETEFQEDCPPGKVRDESSGECVDSPSQEEVTEEIQEEPLKEWYGNSIYGKLLKEYTRRKK